MIMKGIPQEHIQNGINNEANEIIYFRYDT